MVNSFEFKGRLTDLSSVREFTRDEQKVRSRELTFETWEGYPQSMVGTVYGDRCDAAYALGAEYVVRFNLHVRLGADRKFNSVKIWAIQPVN